MLKTRFPIVLQAEMAECALACLAMLTTFYGFPHSLSYLRQLFPLSLKGITVAQLKLMAESLGFAVAVLRIELNSLDKLHLPAILHWQHNHFVILKGRKGGRYVVYDPAAGKKFITLEKLDKNFTGIAMELLPQKIIPTKKNFSKSWRLLSQHMWQLRYVLCAVFLIGCFAQCAYFSGIYLIQSILDHALKHSEITISLQLLLLFTLLKLIEMSSIALRSLMVAFLHAKINLAFTEKLMQHLLYLPLRFFLNRNTGDILSRFGAIEKMKSMTADGMIESSLDCLFAFILLFVLFYYQKTLAAVILISSLLYLVLRFTLEKQNFFLQQAVLQSRALEMSQCIETLHAISAIKLFSKAELRLTAWKMPFIRTLNALTQKTWRSTLLKSGQHILVNADFIFILLYGYQLLSRNQISFGAFFAFLFIRQHYLNAFMQFVDKIPEWQLFSMHLNKLDDIYFVEKEILPTSSLIDYHQPLIFENISFQSSAFEKPILNNINFCIEPEECVAITGPSGCGKTTLLKMAMGLLLPSRGRMRMGACVIQESNLLTYRQGIAGVLQEDILLTGTLEENITFFAKEVNPDRLYRAAEVAGILDEILAMPMRFQTLVSNLGAILSGGQKQRVLLARAIYAQPKILFLDEASSHLDIAKEREINQALRSLKITQVLVAHRLETLQMADRIIRLDK